MATLVEPRVAGDFILTEGAARLSREVKTVASGSVLKIGQVCVTNAAGKKVPVAGTGNEAHTYDPDAAPTGGTFTLSLWHKDGYVVETTQLAYDAAQATIQTAINAVLGASAVTVVGTAATTIVVTFAGGGYQGISWPMGFMDFSNLIGIASCPVTRSTSAGAAQNEQHTINIAGTVSGGSFRLLNVPMADGSLVNTGGIAHDATFANVITNINAALDAATGVAGAIVASGTAYTAIVLTWSGTGQAGKPIATLPQPQVSSLTGATVASAARTRSGGAAGSEIDNKADSICLEDVDASAADKLAVFVTRHAVVNGDKLYYGGGDPDACMASLALVDIVARREPAKAQYGP